MSAHDDLAHYKTQLAESDARLEAEQEHNSALRKIVDGLEALAAAEALAARRSGSAVAAQEPTPTPTEADGTVGADNADRPASIVEGARIIYRESGRQWRTQELHVEMEQRNWIAPEIKNPIEAVRAAVKRLHELGEITRVGFGTYVWAETLPMDLDPPSQPANGGPQSSSPDAVQRVGWSGTGATPPGGST